MRKDGQFMKIYNGKSIYKGIAIGKIKYMKKTEPDTSRHEISDIKSEMKRYDVARKKAILQLKKIYRDAISEIGEDAAAIFDVQSMMLEDDDYNESVQSMIEENKDNAEFAVFNTGEIISSTFAEMDDDYMKARAYDIKDVSLRVVNILCGNDSESILDDEPVILAIDELTPAETVQMDKSKLLSFVTKYGSSNSHTAILARTINIPAVTGVIIDQAWNGKMAIVNGETGEIIIEPDEKTMNKMLKKRKKIEEEFEILQKLKGMPNRTKSGKEINLYANIGGVEDVEKVLENDANGIGLFRSEFLYLGRNDYPTEEQQFVAYKNVVRKMKGKKVIIRTLDIGADKKADYFNLEKEDNPAMGFRAIRICLACPKLFKTQLRAIYRASAYGTISIMYPMIISLQEVQKVKEISAEVRSELNLDNIPYGDVEQGIMIETPAAVIMSDELACEVDFFSIGTNDLTQYTLAMDRQNCRLESMFDTHHPAILRQIKTTIDNAHKHNCWVGICGELAADLSLTKTFIDMGIDELSVSPSSVLPVRQKIREAE